MQSLMLVRQKQADILLTQKRTNFNLNKFSDAIQNTVLIRAYTRFKTVFYYSCFLFIMGMLDAVRRIERTLAVITVIMRSSDSSDPVSITELFMSEVGIKHVSFGKRLIIYKANTIPAVPVRTLPKLSDITEKNTVRAITNIPKSH